jgi:hypothetical protein
VVTPKVSKETLKAMATLLGLEFSAQRLEELLPRVQQMVKDSSDLDGLNLNDVEPAVIFRPESG